ncbi:thermonuclease family protein [Sphingomonas sp. PB1R3]|uniref:thermonuclease family protein n=1 Tax=Sphingomonas flavida TaxID=3096154 RepID=UPI002FC67045
MAKPRPAHIAAALCLVLSGCKPAIADFVSSQRADALVARGRAIDGDTVSVDFRLFGADAYEKRQLCERQSGCWPCGKAAQDYAARFLKRGNATIQLTGSQSYGRPVAVITVDGQDMGEAMIEAGLAVPALRYLKADPDRAERYSAAFNRAAAAHVGAQDGNALAPDKWRRGERLSCESRRGPATDPGA